MKRKRNLDEYGDPIVEDCLVCGVALPKWEPIYCCDFNTYCDCRGLPINEPICDKCSYEDVNGEGED